MHELSFHYELFKLRIVLLSKSLNMLHTREENNREIKSPCRGVCTLDHKGKCIGCFRKLDEIANWSVYNDFQRSEILKMTQLRMQLPDIFDS